MRFLLWIVLASTLSFTAPLTFAQSDGDTGSGGGGGGSSSRFRIHARGGLLITPADPEVTDRWEHNTFFSYAFGFGGDIALIRRSEFSIFAGAEFDYFVSDEQLTSSLSSSFITTELMHLVGRVGIDWDPSFAQRLWGLQFVAGIPAWAQKHSRLETRSGNRDLGSERLVNSNWYVIGIGGYYRLTSRIAASMNYEFRDDMQVLWMGGRYEF